jgi:hypothetical protein
MNSKLDEELCKKYPLIFQDRRSSEMETAMCWGFDCGDGWYNIIECLCRSVQNYIDNNNNSIKRLLASNKHNLIIPDPIEQVVAQQVKEKFAGLRFYYYGGDDITDGMVQVAECLSEVTCEECGAPGTHNMEGWMRTLCDEHKKV